MRKLHYILVFLTMALVLLVMADCQLREEEPEIIFLDVGQGDAILIQQGTTQVLVDGGPDATVIESLGKYLPFWDRTIELVILTHAHSDHYLGLIDVFDRFTVNKFMWSGADEHAEDYEVFQELVRREECEVALAAADQDWVLGDVTFDVLFPFTADQFLDQAEENLNNTSIVMRVTGPQQTVLLTGDAETPVEDELLAHNTFLQADILKAGHHGSKTSSSQKFIEAVAPQKVIFCAGQDNKFNHPADLIVSRYQNLEIETLTLWQTDDIKEDL